MMGISCEDPTIIYGDNQSVLANTTIPDSMLKKKSQSIAYHFVREGAALDEWRTTYVNTHENGRLTHKAIAIRREKEEICSKAIAPHLSNIKV